MTIPHKALSTRSTAIAVIAACILALILLAVGASRLIYPFDVGHYEACIWTPALLSAEAHNPYAYALNPPFVMAPYGYAYYWLVGLGLRAFGLQFWFGRLLTILAAAVCLYCVIRIAYQLNRNREAACLAALSFLASLPLHHWVGVHRPDLPALALALAGLAIAFDLAAGADQISTPAVLAALLLTGAFFFKQTAILPAAIGIAVCWQQHRRRLAVFILLVGLSVAVVTLLLLNLTSDGQYFWQHFTLMKQVPHSYATSWQWVLSILRTPAIWVTFMILIAALYCELRRWRQLEAHARITWLKACVKSPGGLFIFYFISAAAFGFITSARQGSYISYHLETLMAGSIVVGLAWGRFGPRGNRPLLYQALVLAFLVAGGFQLIRQGRGELLRWQALPYYREVVATLRQNMPPQSLGISVHPELMIAAGHDYDFGDWNQYEDGRSAQLHQIFRQAVESKRYAAIVWLRADAASEFPGYHLVSMKQPLPQGYYPVFVYLRD